MKSAIKKFKKRGAFSLVEALIAVALIGILAAVTFIAVARYQRNMQLLKMDATAKEMFIAAQNHLSMAEGQGFLDIPASGFGTPEGGTGPEVRYLMVDGKSPTLNDSTSVLSLMLPVGSIDDGLRTGGNYIIRYQKEPARILDVFYAENSGRFAHEPAFEEGQYSALLGIRENSDERKNYSYSSTVKGAVIGYYGGVAAADIPVAGKVKAPSLSVENGDKLQAVVTWTKTEAGEKLFLVIRGLSSGAETSLIGFDTSDLPGTYIRSIPLDDISGADTRFCDVVKNSTLATKFWPGEDIEIYAKAFNSGGLSNISYSAKLITNSLFASVSGSTGDRIANISSIRHLENLDPAISSLDVANTGIKSAVQQNNLSWASYREAVKGGGTVNNVKIYDADDVPTSAGCYMPINPYYLSSYDGGGRKIDGIKVDTAGDAGLFGTLNSTAGIEIKNLELLNFDIKSTAGNAGALAGSINSSALLSEILVRNDIEDDSTLKINAENSAGGLVGAIVNNGTQNFAAQYCAASVYVKSTSGASGGLIGSIGNSEKPATSATITGCYSGGHTEDGKYADTSFNVISNTTGGIAAGGLIGDASAANIIVNNSYSTCSVKGATPGGFIGKVGSGSISNCYSTGKVSKGGAQSVHPFAGDKGTGVTYTGNEYLQGISGSELAQGDVATGKSAEDMTSADKGPAVPYDPKVLSENIEPSGSVSYKFNTIANLIPSLGANSFVRAHYGDWQKSGIIAGPIKATIVNGNDLIVYLELPRTTGMTSAEVTLALKRASSPDSAPVYISYPMKLTKGGGGWTAVLEKPGAPASVQAICNYLTFLETASGGEDILKIGVVLDSVTKQGAHFTQLTAGSSIEPGEDIAIRACSGKVNSWGEIANDYEVKTNSLFADKLPPSTSFNPTAETAKIAFARHLLNLDPLVSEVRDGITAARFTEDVSFTGIGAIYSSDGNKTANSYHPIYNKNLTLLNGYWHAISGINYDAASDGISGTAAGALTTPGKGNAGLFRLTDKSGGFTINELALKNCSFETTGGHAGSFVAETTTILNLGSVLACGNTSTVKAVSASMMNSYDAGGLVGRAGAGLTVNNSAASVLVRADIPGGTQTSGAAGGLVGHQASGN
ncbi:MAG: type II secretion system protein, partial [Clostridiales bacterium]|nr:type II secretion system protein [Clostridiales bacterium]